MWGSGSREEKGGSYAAEYISLRGYSRLSSRLGPLPIHLQFTLLPFLLGARTLSDTSLALVCVCPAGFCPSFFLLPRAAASLLVALPLVWSAWVSLFLFLLVVFFLFCFSLLLLVLFLFFFSIVLSTPVLSPPPSFVPSSISPLRGSPRSFAHSVSPPKSGEKGCGRMGRRSFGRGGGFFLSHTSLFLFP